MYRSEPAPEDIRCTIEGCINPTLRQGLCNAHYLRLRRKGSPTAGRVMVGTYERWLDENVRSVDTDDCIVWPFGTDSKGYARLNGRRLLHRELCIEFRGSPPFEGAHAAHTCGKGSNACINPNHLVWKTQTDNERDKVRHGTHNRGERHPMSRLNEDAVRMIRALPPEDFSNRQLADLLKVSPTSISNVRTGKSWPHVK